MEGCSLNHSNVLRVINCIFPAYPSNLLSHECSNLIFGVHLAVKLLQQYRLAVRRGMVCIGGTLFPTGRSSVSHPGAADLSAVGGQMMMTGRSDCRGCTAQPLNRFDSVTLHESCVFWWVWGAEQHLLPHTCLKA